MGGDVNGGLLGVGQVHDLHVARVGAGEGQQRVVAVGTQHAETWREQKKREAGCEIIDGGNPQDVPGLQPTERESGCGEASPAAGRCLSAGLSTAGRTFGVVAGLKDVQLMGVVGEGEDFDH